MGVAPHDLLRIVGGSVLLDADGSRVPVPPWAVRSLARYPWVVVRRGIHREGRLPVGVRGDIRRQRYGAWIDAECALQRVTPEQLALRAPAAAPPRWRAPLGGLASIMAGVGLEWGPVGSLGFELTTGAASTGEASDLDVLARAPSPGGEWETLAVRLRDLGRTHGCRVDCLVETPAGGVHLEELVTPGPLLARTNSGPVMVADPWQPLPRGAIRGQGAL